MTAVVDPLAPSAEPRRRGRRRALTAIAALLGLIIVGGGIGWLVYIHHYQPVGRAGFMVSGPDDPRTMVRVTDGLQAGEWIVRGPVGTRGTIGYTIANNGPFDITLLGPGPDSDLTYQLGQPFVTLSDGSSGESTSADAHPLPATVHAHQAVELFVTVVKKGCAPDGSQIVDDLPIRWKALGVHHETDISLSPDGQQFLPIAVCFPRSALRHIESFS